MLIFGFALLACWLPQRAQAQGGIDLIEANASYTYGQWLTIEGEFESPSAIVEGHIFLHSEAQNRTDVIPAEITDGRGLQAEVLLQGSNGFPAFSSLTYWFVVANAEDAIYESEKFSLYYEDNRYDWQDLRRGGLEARWYEGDEAFGQAILSAADKGAQRLQMLLPLAAPQEATFQVYPSAAGVQEVLQLTGYDWVAGHTDPDLDLILLAIAPGAQQSLEIERQVPHEVAHLMLIQELGAEGAAALPVWLVEGLVSNAEVYSDPDRQELLELAYGSGSLIPLSQLCRSFPQDSAQARLAYAEAAAFVSFLHEQAGAAGFEALFDLYVENPDCINAPLPLFAQDLNGLEAEWLAASFEEARGLDGLLDQLPWENILISAVFALLLFGFFWGLNKRAAEKNK